MADNGGYFQITGPCFLKGAELPLRRLSLRRGGERGEDNSNLALMSRRAVPVIGMAMKQDILIREASQQERIWVF